MKNTTNPDNAYYELFALPKDPDPSNPECKYLALLVLLQLFICHTAVHNTHLPKNAFADWGTVFHCSI